MIGEEIVGHIEAAEEWLGKAERQPGWAVENTAIARTHIELAKLKANLMPPIETPLLASEVAGGKISTPARKVTASRPLSESVADGVRDPLSATGWAPGQSPRSVYGDEH